MIVPATRCYFSKGKRRFGYLDATREKKKFEIPHCKGEQCLPLRGKHDYNAITGKFHRTFNPSQLGAPALNILLKGVVSVKVGYSTSW